MIPSRRRASDLFPQIYQYKAQYLLQVDQVYDRLHLLFNAIIDNVIMGAVSGIRGGGGKCNEDHRSARARRKRGRMKGRMSRCQGLSSIMTLHSEHCGQSGTLTLSRSRRKDHLRQVLEKIDTG